MSKSIPPDNNNMPPPSLLDTLSDDVFSVVHPYLTVERDMTVLRCVHKGLRDRKGGQPTPIGPVHVRVHGTSSSSAISGIYFRRAVGHQNGRAVMQHSSSFDFWLRCTPDGYWTVSRTADWFRNTCTFVAQCRRRRYAANPADLSWSLDGWVDADGNSLGGVSVGRCLPEVDIRFQSFPGAPKHYVEEMLQFNGRYASYRLQQKAFQDTRSVLDKIVGGKRRCTLAWKSSDAAGEDANRADGASEARDPREVKGEANGVCEANPQEKKGGGWYLYRNIGDGMTKDRSFGLPVRFVFPEGANDAEKRILHYATADVTKAHDCDAKEAVFHVRSGLWRRPRSKARPMRLVGATGEFRDVIDGMYLPLNLRVKGKLVYQNQRMPHVFMRYVENDTWLLSFLDDVLDSNSNGIVCACLNDDRWEWFYVHDNDLQKRSPSDIKCRPARHTIDLISTAVALSRARSRARVQTPSTVGS